MQNKLSSLIQKNMDKIKNFEQGDDDRIVERIKRDFEIFLDKKYGPEYAETKNLLKEALGSNKTIKEPEKIKLSSDQVRSLTDTIEKSLGVDLRPEQTSALFEQSIEHLTTTLNSILRKKFIDPLRQKDVKKKKFTVPLGDCIKIEYSEDGEMIGFLIRPKLANLVFLKDKTDTENIGQILKIVIYLNRLLTKG